MSNPISPSDYHVITKDEERIVINLDLLALHSLFFRALQNSEMIESGQKCVSLPLVGAGVLSQLIEFGVKYRSDELDKSKFIPLSLDNWAEIYEAAEFLQMPEVTSVCLEFIGDYEGIDLLDELIEFSSASENAAACKRALHRCIARNFTNKKGLKVRDAFESLPFKFVVDILDDVELVADETFIFDAVMNWIEKDRDNRSGHFSSLMNHIRFCRGGKSLLEQAIMTEYVQLDRGCFKMLNGMIGRKINVVSQLKLGKKTESRGAHDSFFIMGGACKISRNHLFPVYEFNKVHITRKTKVDTGMKRFDTTKILNHSAVEVHGLCFSAGGQVEDIPLGASRIDAVGARGYSFMKATDRVQVYDNDGQNIKPLDSMNQSRYSFVLLHSGGHVYAIGGCSDASKLSYCERYSIAKDEWEIFASLPSPLSHHAGVVVKGLEENDSFFICGGYQDVGGDPTDETLVSNPGEDWRRVAKMPVARAMHAVVFHRRKVFVIGGTCGKDISKPLASVDVYDPKSDKWFPFPPLPVPLADLKAGVILDQIHVFGGITLDASGRVEGSKRVLRYDHDASRWIDSSSHFQYELPAMAFAFATFKSKEWEWEAGIECHYNHCPFREMQSQLCASCSRKWPHKRHHMPSTTEIVSLL